jgi:predicted nucleic-acid-binding Zn-ribbon protein
MEQPDRYQQAAELIRKRLPEIRCLRCGHDEFFVDTHANALSTGRPNSYSPLRLHNMINGSKPTLAAAIPVITLACSRCGNIESHLTGVLLDSEEPIPTLEPLDG